jgi:hypothetical protein
MAESQERKGDRRSRVHGDMLGYETGNPVTSAESQKARLLNELEELAAKLADEGRAEDGDIVHDAFKLLSEQDELRDRMAAAQHHFEQIDRQHLSDPPPPQAFWDRFAAIRRFIVPVEAATDAMGNRRSAGRDDW